MQIFALAPLMRAALDLLLARHPAPVDAAAVAAALEVPHWAAEAALARLQEAGDVLPVPGGWRLSCSAEVALALSLPACLRGAGGR